VSAARPDLARQRENLGGEGPKIGVYADGEAPYMYEPHSEGVNVEREELSDGSHVYNVQYSQPDGLRLRIGAYSEEHAWALAEELANVAHVTVLEDVTARLSETVRPQ